LAQPSGITVVQEYKIAFFADSESSSIRRLHLDSGKVSAVCGGDKNPEVRSTQILSIYFLILRLYV